MKYIFTLIFLFLSLRADEIQRIEAIVNDITQLKHEYAQCQEKMANKDTQKEFSAQKEKEYKNTIDNLKNQISNYKKELKTKENIINKLSLNNKTKVKTKEKEIKALVSTKCTNNNSFPRLMMKDKYAVEFFEASAFRLNKKSDIYDAIDGDVVATWDNKTSFTSNQKTNKWVKITGYFVNKVWQSAQEELWVQSINVTKH